MLTEIFLKPRFGCINRRLCMTSKYITLPKIDPFDASMLINQMISSAVKRVFIIRTSYVSRHLDGLFFTLDLLTFLFICDVERY